MNGTRIEIIVSNAIRFFRQYSSKLSVKRFESNAAIALRINLNCLSSVGKIPNTCWFVSSTKYSIPLDLSFSPSHHFSPGWQHLPMVKQRPIFFFCALMAVYFLVRWALIFGETGILRWYLTDLLFVPAMCSFGLIFVRILRREPRITLKWRHVFTQVVFVSIYFEWYLPKNYNQYTADPWDVVMYIFGGIVYLLVQKWLYETPNKSLLT